MKSNRTLRILTIAVASMAAITVACNKTTNDYRADHGVKPCEYTKRLDSLFTPIFPDDGPGAIVTVMRNDSIIYDHAFGLADLNTKARITDSTLFNMASTSKFFSAVAIMKLCERGEMSLDDPLSKYFPEFEADFFKNIKIRNILTHSSGLPDLRPRDPKEWHDYLSHHKSIFSDAPDYRLYGMEREHMQIFKDLDSIDYNPSTTYQRSDPAFILVAPLIERVTGHDFDDWMRQNIFLPAGLTDTYYYNPGCFLPRMAHGYKPADRNTAPGIYLSEDGKWQEYDYGEAEFFLTKADRGAYSSARDIMRWNKAVYSGKLLPKEIIDSLNTPRLATDIPFVNYGYANAVEEKPGRNKKIYHLNTNGGFTIFEATVPERKMSYLIFSNRDDFDDSLLVEEMEKILY